MRVVQIIKHFQNEGYIERTCIFEVKRIAKIPKREKNVLTSEQLAQLFKITNKKYPYLTPIIQNLIILKQPLNTINRERKSGRAERSELGKRADWGYCAKGTNAKLCEHKAFSRQWTTKEITQTQNQKRFLQNKTRYEIGKLQARWFEVL